MKRNMMKHLLLLATLVGLVSAATRTGSTAAAAENKFTVVKDTNEYEEVLSDIIERFVNLGLVVHVTEMDVKCPSPCGEADLKRQAELYGAVVRACVKNARKGKKAGCKSVETWGFTDRYSWLNGERCEKKPGPCHALPYDENYRPKPAHDTIIKTLSPGAKTLKEAGATRGVYVGSQFKYEEITNTSDPTYKTLHAQQFSLSTVGNQCKWAATHPKRDEFTLDNCVKSLQYASSSDQVFRGHNLGTSSFVHTSSRSFTLTSLCSFSAWGNNNPTWLTDGNWTTPELKTLLRHHISRVMKGVGDYGSVYAWDVVNEACANDNSSGVYFKDNFWYPALPDYVDVAFSEARRADPSTLLFYNDFGMSTRDGKSLVVYDMVKSMIDRGIPIDGVGFQQHLSLS